MSLFEEAMAVAVKLPMEERQRLVQALGVQSQSSPPQFSSSLPIAKESRPDPVAWRKAETGHAVLATEQGLSDQEIPEGAQAIAGIWSHRATESEAAGGAKGSVEIQQIPAGSPVLVHTSLCWELALGRELAINFFANAPVEIRLATATYLSLLDAAESIEQQRRIRRFVQPFAVLSLGPMASSSAVELMLESNIEHGLAPLDALIAATAIAHEIPLVSLDTKSFAGIDELPVAAPY